MKHLLGAFSLSVAVIATPALAGLKDSPLPVLEAGSPTMQLYSVPGVLLGPREAVFSCTSVATKPVRVGVELFNATGGVGNDAVATSASVSPGHTVVFLTRGIAYSDYCPANVCNYLNPTWLLRGNGPGEDPTDYPFYGSARILSTDTHVLCAAFLTDDSHSPGLSLPMVNETAAPAVRSARTRVPR